MFVRGYEVPVTGLKCDKAMNGKYLLHVCIKADNGIPRVNLPYQIAVKQIRKAFIVRREPTIAVKVRETGDLEFVAYSEDFNPEDFA